MALDEPREDDIRLEQEGVSFVVDKQLVNYLPDLTIGFRKSWLGTGLYVEAVNTFC